MTDADEPRRWVDGQRRDGLRVAMVTRGASWFIQPTNGRPAVTLCPCCDKPLITQRAAMLVADQVYPLTDMQ